MSKRLKTYIAKVEIQACDRKDAERRFEKTAKHLIEEEGNPYSAILSTVFTSSTSCKKCGSDLRKNGKCTDETCPYSDRQQHETYTEG